VLLQQPHDLRVVLLGRGLHLGGPVIDIPVVADPVDQLVVLRRLLGAEVLEMLGRKGAQQKIVLQHSALARLVQKPGGEVFFWLILKNTYGKNSLVGCTTDAKLRSAIDDEEKRNLEFKSYFSVLHFKIKII